MKKKKISIGRILAYLFLLSGVFVTVFPMFWMLLTSLKTQTEAIQVPPVIFPRRLIFENYATVFQKIPFSKMYLNTIISAAATVVGQLVICSMAAYAFARLKFPGRDVIFIVILGVLMIPSSLFILPQYLVVQKMKLLNTIVALFLPNLFSAFGTFLMRQFFKSLPAELEDAARLDGCNRFMIYARIMLPLVRSGLVALGIITLRFAWNDLMWPMIVNTSTEKMTLSAGLSYLQGQHWTDYPAMMAGAVMSVVPLLILFAVFQKQFIEGIAMSGIKG